MRKHKWTDEELDWLKLNYKIHTMSELVILFNAHFSTNLSTRAVQNYCRRKIGAKGGQNHSTRLNCIRINYTDEEDAWIRENNDKFRNVHELHEAFVLRFPNHRVTYRGFLTHYYEKLKLKLSDEQRSRIRGDYAIGDVIRLGKKKQPYVKIQMHGTDMERWRPLSYIMYEKYYGKKVDEDERVIYLNGDVEDLSQDNLYVVKKSWVPMLNRNGWLKGNRDVTFAGIRYCQLFYALQERIKCKHQI